MVINGEERQHGFIFSLLNPPVPLGGNIVSLDIFVDELPVQRNSIFLATSDEVVNVATLSESRPIAFKPYQSARFLIIKEGGLDDKVKHKRSEEHMSELQSRQYLVCRLLLEKKNQHTNTLLQEINIYINPS